MEVSMEVSMEVLHADEVRGGVMREVWRELVSEGGQ